MVERIPVVIVGGGGCGLVSSSMLSNLGIQHVLIESHPNTAHLPKASLLNQRTAEILDQHGLWSEILKVGCPPELMKWYYYMTSLGGDGATDRFELDKIPCYGCNNDPGTNSDYRKYRKYSAYTHCNLPLIRLEPLLKQQAELRNPGKILFNHKMIAFQEHDEHVTVEVLNKTTGEKMTFLAQFVIAADGGKTFGPALGIHYEGPRNLADTTSVHFKADLSAHWQDGALINYIIGLQGQSDALATGSPLFGGDWSACVMTGPSWGRRSEEWALHIGLGQNHLPLESFTHDSVKKVIRRSLNIPELQLEILSVSRWHIDGIYATRYQTKRIFLAGDAAHRHPPITGLGLNTGIGDAHNITWKLAAVLKGQAPMSLLLTYEEERLPVGKRVVEWALFAFMNLRVLDSALGLIPGGSMVSSINEQIYEQVVSDTFDGAARRAALSHAVQSQRVETAAHDLELGSIYPTGAFIPDGSNAPPVDPRGHLYVPLGRPGHRLPHAWLQGSRRVSSHHLLDNSGSWVMITDTSASSVLWNARIADLQSRTGLRIKTFRIGLDGDFEDATGQWGEDTGLVSGNGGAILVRPDHYVAFRALECSDETLSQLDHILDFMGT